MCTLVIAAGIVPDYPLLIVANRDEQKDRASSPPKRYELPAASGTASVATTRFVAPRDEVAGGTWLGLNEHGVLVAITNRFLGPRDNARVSRGALVLEALQGSSARAIHASMSRIDPRRYNGFHLVYADADDVLATASDGVSSLAQLVLGRGLSIITERSFGAASGREELSDLPRARKIRAAWSRLVSDGAGGGGSGGGFFDPQKLTTLLTEHDALDPLGATCIHLDELGYGTRSSMVLSMQANKARESGGLDERWKMLWAEGPPCISPFTEVDLTPSVGEHG